MLSNPNNVAVEASPCTTLIEHQVGLQLAELVGYNTLKITGKPLGWGHITADGSIANVESMWAGKKSSPIEGTSLTHVQSSNQGTLKLLQDFTSWELLNITPPVVLDIPSRLGTEYGITSQFLQDALKPYLIQTVGKDYLEHHPDFRNPSEPLSWPSA
ncbi:hypothetical protein D9757_007948 [Collybiopsis confluens]|uniref:Uncharacterized protein n=1 Tax=Collybiopsis confluens TaxID=2823264 RepID=A0A8H5HBU2_9AGAR|nr:hypothetical protein D9757_007948 [Collybiopsis confluens]